jgi:F-type H+-transporting ATPase subunit epsilon
MPFALEVLTPEAALWSGPANALVLATSEGNLTVLTGHTSLIGDVVPGAARIEPEEGPTVHLAVHGGFLQVDTSRAVATDAEGTEAAGPIPGLATRVTVLAGIAELASEIDAERAERAREAAEAKVAGLRAGGALAVPEGGAAAHGGRRGPGGHARRDLTGGGRPAGGGASPGPPRAAATAAAGWWRVAG